LFDEIQHVFKYGGKAAERNLDILKNISNKTSCRFIGMGTYEISFSIEKSAQLSRRTIMLEFPGYSVEIQTEFQQFLSAYSGLLAHMPVEISQEVATFARDAYVGCCGCIGVLKEWLNRALREALKQGVALSVQHLRGTRLKGSQLKPIAEEIREGRVFFLEPEDSEIMALLGGVELMQPEKSESTKANTQKPKPGVRNPKRDEVQ